MKRRSEIFLHPLHSVNIPLSIRPFIAVCTLLAVFKLWRSMKSLLVGDVCEGYSFAIALTTVFCFSVSVANLSSNVKRCFSDTIAEVFLAYVFTNHERIEMFIFHRLSAIM